MGHLQQEREGGQKREGGRRERGAEERRAKLKTEERKEKEKETELEKGCVGGTVWMGAWMVLYIAVVVFDVGAPEYYMLIGIRNPVDRIRGCRYGQTIEFSHRSLNKGSEQKSHFYRNEACSMLTYDQYYSVLYLVSSCF